MAKYLDNNGLAHLIDKIKDGTLKAGAAAHADSASSVPASGVTGVLPMSAIPKGAVEQLVIVANEAARLALTTDQVQNGDTVKQEDNKKMYYVVDDTKLGTAAAFEEYIVGTADSVGHALKVTVGTAAQKTYDGSNEVTLSITPSSVGAATSAQGTKADSAVQTIQINGVTQTKTNGTVNLPAYPEVITQATGIVLSDNYAPQAEPTPGPGVSVEWAIRSLDYAQTTKVDKIAGKGLSTNDYTTAEKEKLAGIATGATANTGTVTEVIVGAGLKVTGGATGSKITTSGTISVVTDSTPTDGSVNLMTSGALYQLTQGLVPKTQQATLDTLGLVKLGSDTQQTVAANSPTATTGKTYPVQVDAQGHAVVNVPWANDTYTPAKLGFGRGTCTTAAATAAKAVTLSGYTLVTGGFVAVQFTNAVGASATLNINSKGAKPIYFRGANITADIIAAGDTATFVYDGTNYHLLCVDRPAITNSEIDSLIEASAANDAG